jgi:hypothetical protein
MVRLQSYTKMHKPLYIVYTIYPMSWSALGGVMPNAVLFFFFLTIIGEYQLLLSIIL